MYVSRSDWPRLGRWLAAISVIAVACTLSACRSERAVEPRDLEEFRRLMTTGLTIEGDPYVRAETLRVLEQVGDPKLIATRAKPLLEDDSPMVRVAALRAMTAAELDEAADTATRQFNEASGAERRAILQAVLEHGSPDLQLDLLGRALRPADPGNPTAEADLRRFAFEQGLVPKVERALEASRTSRVHDIFAPRISRYVQDMDPVLAGPVLRLLLRIDEPERAEPILEVLENEEAPLERRLRAARILTEARAEQAESAFESIVEAAEIDPDDDRLRFPEPRVDKRLVRAAVLGLVAIGETEYVSRAKLHLEDADADAYIEVLEALSTNPDEGAVLSLKTAMLDARPRVRYRAIELYSKREEAKVEHFLSILRSAQFERQMEETRRTIAKELADHFPEGWVERLRKQLTSQEGIPPALKLLRHVSHRTDVSETLGLLKERLMEIARAKEDRRATLAAYLLVELADDPEVAKLLRNFEHPLPRYAYLEHVLAKHPAEHIDFLRSNFYPDSFELELFAIRLISGAALWKANQKLYVDTRGDAGTKGARRDAGASGGD